MTRNYQKIEDRTHIPVPKSLKTLLDGLQNENERSWETYQRIIEAGIRVTSQTAVTAPVSVK